MKNRELNKNRVTIYKLRFSRKELMSNTFNAWSGLCDQCDISS